MYVLVGRRHWSSSCFKGVEMLWQYAYNDHEVC